MGGQALIIPGIVAPHLIPVPVADAPRTARPSLVRRLFGTKAAEPTFYLQVSFSGCAGMAEVSARMASHWAERWYLDEASSLASEQLAPWGFAPSPYTASWLSELLFVPVPDVGYVEYLRAGDRENEAVPFDCDVAVAEDADGAERLEKVGAYFSRLSIERCLCQVCTEANIGGMSGRTRR